MSVFSQPLSQALTPKKANLLPALLLALGVLLALGAAAYGYLESQRTERVVIAVRAIPFGHQISAGDLGTIELSLHRPIQVAGLSDPQLIVGRWAAREIGPNDLLQPSMLLAQPPDQPVYSSGIPLAKNMVPIPFATATIGPLTIHDRVNIGFNDPNGDPALCRRASEGAGAAPAEPILLDPVAALDPAMGGGRMGRPYACRLLQRLKVLDVDATKGIAYLEVTPYQAHAIWAVQAAGLPLWGERYGATSDPLPAIERLDVSQFEGDRMAPAPIKEAPLEPGPRDTPPTSLDEPAAPPGRAQPAGATTDIPGAPETP